MVRKTFYRNSTSDGLLFPFSDPNFAPASLDEAYMNNTSYVHKSGMTAEAAIAQMRAEVKLETGLTVSAGCGANTMLAKIAADINKPDGQCVVSARCWV